MNDFLFYPRSRIAGIGENQEQKMKKSVVKKAKKNIDIQEDNNKASFISKKKKNDTKR